MTRKRKNNKQLPSGLYPHGKKWRRRIYIGKERKLGWQTFDDLNTALQTIAADIGEPTHGVIAAGIKRYARDVLPKKLAIETQRSEVPRLKRLSRVFGHMHPDDLTQQMLYQYADRRPAIGGNRELSRLGAVYKYMIRWGMASKNPCIGLMREAEPKRSRRMSDSELELALNVALNHAFHISRPAIIVYGVMRLEDLTGRRESNILALKLSDITEGGLRFYETKRVRRNSRGEIVKEPRVVLFKWTVELRQAVTEIRRLTRHDSKVESLYLFPNRDGGRCSLGSFNRAWQKLRPDMFKMAGLDKFQPRDVRAKFASDLKKLGRDVQDSLGHSDAKTTEDHYLRDDIILEPSR